MLKRTKRLCGTVKAKVSRRGWVIFALVVVGVVLTPPVWLWAVVTEMPVFERDYLAEFNAARVEGESDSHSWPVMVRAVEELGQLPTNPVTIGGGRIVDVEIDRDLRPGDAEWDRLAEYLGRPEVNAGLDRLREVTEKTSLGFVHTDADDPELAAAQAAIYPEVDWAVEEPSEHPAFQTVMLPYLGIARRLSDQLLSRAYIRGFGLEAAADSVRDIEAAVLIAGHVERQGVVLTGLVASRIVSQAATTTLEMLSRDVEIVEGETLNELVRVFSAWQGRVRVNVFELNATSSRDLLQRVYGKGGSMTAVGVWRIMDHEDWDAISRLNRLDEGMKGAPELEQAIAVFTRGSFPKRSAVEAEIDAMEPALERLSQLHPWEVAGSEPMGVITESADRLEGMHGGYEGLGLEMANAKRLVLAMTDQRTTEVSEVGAVCFVAELIQRWKADREWPSGASSEARAVDGFTGGTLGVAVGEDGPMVYSFGTDRNDDGGRVCSDPTNFWWPLDAVGFESRTPAKYDGDWVLWTLSLHEDRVAERVAAAVELEED